ncbi:MAG: hypothetical protein KAQ66_08710, partial [Rhodospirillaceae bacterium]|nr:hypothetical protein [Rhodospirillaceae bacterium]
LIKRSAEDMNNVSDNTIHNLGTAGDNLRKQLSDISMASTQASTKIEGVADVLMTKGNDAISVSEEALSRLSQIGESLGRRSEEVESVTEHSLERLDRFAGLIQSNVKDASERTEKFTDSLSHANEIVTGRLVELNRLYGRAEKGINLLGDALDRQGRNVGTISENAVAKVVAWDSTMRERVSELTSVSEKVSKQLSDVGGSIERGSKVMREATNEALVLADSLDAKLSKAKADEFMQRAAFISEKLQSVAVDLARISEVSISEDDWRRFNKGEKGIFVRKMLGFKERNTFAAIKNMYQEDGEFRDYVGRYVTEFDNMIEKARERDHDGVLEATFLSSDMGKLYMVLARALGRDV